MSDSGLIHLCTVLNLFIGEDSWRLLEISQLFRLAPQNFMWKCRLIVESREWYSWPNCRTDINTFFLITEVTQTQPPLSSTVTLFQVFLCFVPRLMS